jgi:hypothetical protein
MESRSTKVLLYAGPVEIEPGQVLPQSIRIVGRCLSFAEGVEQRTAGSEGEGDGQIRRSALALHDAFVRVERGVSVVHDYTVSGTLTTSATADGQTPQFSMNMKITPVLRIALGDGLLVMDQSQDP